MKSKRDEMTTITLYKLKLKKMYFIFNLKYRYVALSRGMLHRLSIKSHAQQDLNTQVR
jgi:low temperature requirement protein LtrA